MAEPRDYYEILQVARDADAETIKKQYRKLAMQFHPDRNPGNKEAEDKFKEAAEAYDILSNPEKRAQYDRFGHQAFRGGQSQSGGFASAEDVFSHFGDIFGDFFGGGASSRSRSNQPRRGSDLRYLAEVTLEEVLTGLEKEVSFETEATCGDCKGQGAEKGSGRVACRQCGGAGQVVTRQGFFTMATTCPSCRGAGSTIEKPCKTCRGQGRKAERKNIRVHIPAGVDTGTRLRVGGEGEGGYLGGPSGDLFVEIRVADHPQFERDQEDLQSQLEIPFVQMMLGGEVSVPTLEGKKNLEIPPGTQPGQTLELSGQGLPSLRGSRRGDIVYRILPKFPKKLSNDEEKALRDFAKAQGTPVKDSGGLFGRRK